MPDVKQSMWTQLNLQDDRLSDSSIRKWHQRFQTDPDMIDLTVGEPSFSVAKAFKDSTVQAIHEDASHYAPTQGYLPLRQAVGVYMRTEFEAPVYAADEILITAGATEGVYVTLQALFKSGDTILVPTPAYPLYANIAALLGINVISLDTTMTNFHVTPGVLLEVLGAHPEIKGFIFNDPTNPTGVVYTDDEISALAQVLAQTDIAVVTDEIYGALTFGIKHVTLAKYLPTQTIIIGGLSKSHAMTGYRIGFVLGPQPLMRKISQVHQLVIGSVSLPIMIGSVAVLADRNRVVTMKNDYQKRRDLMMTALSTAGLEVNVPEGAFYLLAKLPDEWRKDADGFVLKVAQEAHVGILPGYIFGADEYVRLSFAVADEILDEALKRMTLFLKAMA